jgi:toxin ParE1/3/4
MPEGPYRVRWTTGAVRDLTEIVGYIARDSSPAAGRVLQRIRAKALALASSPGRGRILPELARIGIRAYRELIVRPYRIVFRVEGRTVFVLAVLDGRRDLEDLLLERLLRSP